MSQPTEDVLSQARTRFTAVNAERDTAAAELAVLRAGGGGSQEAAAGERIRELEVRVQTLDREWEDAHAAFGRALLDEFVRDLGNLAYPPHDPNAASELRLIADNLRRACLAVLSDWPELQEEARQRLRVAPSDPGKLHG